MSDGIILCVDDDRNVLRSLKNQLKRRFKGRMNVETAENVAEALEVLSEMEDEGELIEGHLVVISDWLMPGAKGDALLVEVVRRYPDAVAILLTGQADADARERVLQVNASALEKPWMEDQLGEIIETGLKYA